MTIERGAPWGEAMPLPAGAPTVGDDAGLRAVVESARRRGAEPPTVGLLGGDLCRTLGGSGSSERMRSEHAMTFPVDVVRVVLDGRDEHWFVAHLVARRRAWWGWACVGMNAQWLGDWDLGPRSHPDDGLVDVTLGDLPLGDRWAARTRVRSGTHLPHPALRTERARSTEVVFPRPLTVRLDGVAVGRARTVALTVEPDAIRVVI